MVNIFAGNLSYSATEDDLRSVFEQYGSVERVSVIMDRLTGRSRGFGFVEMPDADQAKSAIQNLHDQELKGRKMLVREAEPRGRRGEGEGGRPRPQASPE